MALIIKNKEVIKRLMENDYQNFDNRIKEEITEMRYVYNSDSISFYKGSQFIASYRLLPSREKRLEQLLNETSFNS